MTFEEFWLIRVFEWSDALNTSWCFKMNTKRLHVGLYKWIENDFWRMMTYLATHHMKGAKGRRSLNTSGCFNMNRRRFRQGLYELKEKDFWKRRTSHTILRAFNKVIPSIQVGASACIDWFWKSGWLIHKSTLCTRIVLLPQWERNA